MSQEIAYNLNLVYAKGSVEGIPIDVTNNTIDVAGSRFVHQVQLIGTAEEAISLGELASLGVAAFKNLDETNYIEIRVATGGVKFLKLLPGEVWPCRLGSGVTAPFAIANTAACYLEYWIFEQ